MSLKAPYLTSVNLGWQYCVRPMTPALIGCPGHPGAAVGPEHRVLECWGHRAAGAAGGVQDPDMTSHSSAACSLEGRNPA